MARCNMKTTHVQNPSGKNRTHRRENPEGYFNIVPSFSFQKYDSNAPWSKTKDNKTIADILKKFHDKGKLLWKEIFQESGGRNHGTNNHYIKVNELSSEARKRVKSLNLDVSELFSMRLDGTTRLWGLINSNGLYYVIWYDPNHEVYEMKR